MSNPYIGTNITGCDSPAIGADRSTYGAKIDTAMGAVDNHDHTSGKGKQVPTGGIVDKAVTATKIADATITATQLADAAVVTAKIADAGVTTAKIADGNVTLAKLAASNTALTATCGGFVRGPSGTGVLVTNLSQALTVSSASNYVRVQLIPDLSGASEVECTGTTFGYIELWRDGSMVCGIQINPTTHYPPGAIYFEDTTMTAGAHTYEIRVTTSGGATIFISNCRMRVTEVK